MNKKITMVGIISLLVVGLAILINIVFVKPASFRGTVYNEPYPSAPDFQLADANGKPIKLSDNQGKVSVLYFGYTYCPDACPTTLAELNLVMKDLDKKADQVQVLFVSVDPKRDTSATMQKYVERFNPTFLGLSGSQTDLEPIWAEYGIFREVIAGSSENNYTINHTSRIFLIDQSGKLRVSYGFQTPPEDISHDIKILLGH